MGEAATNNHDRANAPDAGGPSVATESAGAVRAVSGTLLGRPLAHWREQMAAELGVPSGVTVGAGHQAEIWHAGILAKFVWAEAQAERARAATVWLVVDTDVRDPLELRAPVRAEGALRVQAHRFGAARPAGTAACARTATEPAPFALARGAFEPASVAEGVRALTGALAASTGQPDAALQAFESMVVLGAGFFAPAPVVRTSTLLRSSLGKALIERALADPAGCARAFNEAAAMVPRVARPLASHARDGVELPFWTVRPDGQRARLFATTLRSAHETGAPIWPRAFLTGAIARAALCDRFVHGTGGRIYETATELFFARWLDARLPAFDTATATLRLPFPPDAGPPMVTPAQRRHKWFDPETSDGSPSAAKQRALAEIAALPRRSPARRAAFREMHQALSARRAVQADEFAQLAARAEADRLRAHEAAIRADRTWPFAYHTRQALTWMSDALRSQP